MPEMLNERALFFTPITGVEEQAVQQVAKLARMPFIHRYVAVMPDCHLGRGATVGSVIPTDHAIIPAAVGVDIGCGMIAVKTELDGERLRAADLPGLREGIERRIPLSVGRNNTRVLPSAEPRVAEMEDDAHDSGRLQFFDGFKSDWRKQIGTLGSGNHFIEIVVDEDDAVWAFLHSGSRGIGNRVASWHIKLAQRLCRQWHIKLEDPDLAYFAQGTDEFDRYLRDLQWCQRYAELNREEMMDRVLQELAMTFGQDAFGAVGPSLTASMEAIRCHHNFTQWENWDGRNILVSRKGAIEAKEGQLGLIPGSMGTRSYVVRGLGNKSSFNSAPHGAGRRFSRSAAPAAVHNGGLRSRTRRRRGTADRGVSR